jgi:hypothetical protein
VIVTGGLDDGPAEECQLLLHVLVPSALGRPALVWPGLILSPTLAEPAIHHDGDVLAPAKPVPEVPVTVGVIASHDEQQHQRATAGTGGQVTVRGYRAAPRFPKEFVLT